jgi:hypothetical protein
VIVLGLWIAAWATGVDQFFHRDAVRALVEGAGVRGFAAFVVAFSVGQLLRVPGPVFVAAAILVYGTGMGTVAAIVGALVSVNVSVIFVRSIAGQPLTTLDRPILRRLFRGIDQHPVLVVATLRLIFQTAPVSEMMVWTVRNLLILKRRDGGVVDRARLESETGDAHRVTRTHFVAQSIQPFAASKCSSM